MFTAPEFAEWRSERDMKEIYGISNPRTCWFELANGDFLLCIERHGKYKVWLFVGDDPRDEMEKLLDVPYEKVED